MLGLIGIVVTFAMVFGSYVMAGGKFGIILHAAPHEFMAIFGAAVGAFMLANKGNIIKATLKDLKKAFGGPKWKPQDYKDLLCLMFSILKLVRTKGMIALEQHIENPEQSAIFQQYPKIMHDHFAIELICDTLRMITMSFEDPHQVEDVMEKQLEKHHHETAAPQHAVQTMADGIPALGIVAAVLGVIKTMASLDQDDTLDQVVLESSDGRQFTARRSLWVQYCGFVATMLRDPTCTVVTVPRVDAVTLEMLVNFLPQFHQWSHWRLADDLRASPASLTYFAQVHHNQLMQLSSGQFAPVLMALAYLEMPALGIVVRARLAQMCTEDLRRASRSKCAQRVK